MVKQRLLGFVLQPLTVVFDRIDNSNSNFCDHVTVGFFIFENFNSDFSHPDTVVFSYSKISTVTILCFYC